MSASGFSPAGAQHAEQRRYTPGSFPEADLERESDWTFVHPPHSQNSGHTSSQSSSRADPPPANPDPRRYGPRTCRICLEVVLPTTIPSTIPSIPGIALQPPRVIYESAEPELGRLISPCKCRGSSKYVHEGCLQQWRMSRPNEARNYWNCPTCHYQYRLERLHWAKYIQSPLAQAGLTFLVFLFAMFVMGFVADPLINLYADPWSIIGLGWSNNSLLEPIEPIFTEDETITWFEHFFKGMAGLGVAGFIKFLLASPLQIFRWSRAGSSGSRTTTTGRDRVASLSWIVILVGVATTLWGIYKAVSSFSKRALMATAERVLDVGGDENDE